MSFQIREHEWMHANNKIKFNCLITTYELLMKDKVCHCGVGEKERKWMNLSGIIITNKNKRRKKNDSQLGKGRDAVVEL